MVIRKDDKQLTDRQNFQTEKDITTCFPLKNTTTNRGEEEVGRKPYPDERLFYRFKGEQIDRSLKEEQEKMQCPSCNKHVKNINIHFQRDANCRKKN